MAKTFLIAAAVLAASSAVFGAPAMAQAPAAKAPVILIVDQGRVLATSKVGQSINAQLAKIQEAANAELNAEVEKLVKEQEDLKKQKDLMAEDVWLEKAKQAAVKQNNLPALRDVKVREIGISEQQALAQVNEKLTPILQKFVDSRGATVMLDRSAVMYAAANTDITAEVIAELDKAITTVKVERVSLAELQKQAQAAQAAQAAKAGSKPAKK